jgi:hypothetical protein
LPDGGLGRCRPIHIAPNDLLNLPLAPSEDFDASDFKASLRHSLNGRCQIARAAIAPRHWKNARAEKLKIRGEYPASGGGGSTNYWCYGKAPIMLRQREFGAGGQMFGWFKRKSSAPPQQDENRKLIEASFDLADQLGELMERYPGAIMDSKALDARYGHTSNRRGELYKLFSELAGHPTIKSAWMMRPQKDGDAVIGPFIEKTSLEAILSEMGRLAVQAGQHLTRFFPEDWTPGYEPRLSFARATRAWFATFYPNAREAGHDSPDRE